MFSTSTQLKYWTFSGTTELNHLRSEVNQKYIKTHGEKYDEEQRSQLFLSPAEETKVRRHYEYIAKEFCQTFQPPMPKYVVGTSLIFYKRFYLHNSVMDYHPKDIVYTCIYLACKVEEFNVSIVQFVGNLKGDKVKGADIILSQELLMMQQLHYHLTVHNPYRPMEGLLIDIKTRCSEVDDAEKLRQLAEDFLDKTLHVDICLIFAPSQIALAALLHSASRNGYSLDSYVANKLMASGGKENFMKTVEHIKRIKCMVKNLEQLDRRDVKRLEITLDGCRNQENNPESDTYRDRLVEQQEEEDERRLRKKMKIAEEEKKLFRDLTAT